MNGEDEKKAIAAQTVEIKNLRKELETSCEAKGYTLAQVVDGLKLDEYAENTASDFTWDGLGAPKPWFLKAEKLTREEYWKLPRTEQKKRLEEYPKKT